MYQIAKPLFFICETPLHAGAGGGVGTDLPIQREAHTKFPKIEASGVKGAFREVFEQKYKAKKRTNTDPDLVALFGDPKNGDKDAGAIGLTDARLLLFPVRSRHGVFAWVTCPRVLTRFAGDLKLSTEINSSTAISALQVLAEAIPKGICSVPSTSSITNQAGKAQLEEYSFDAKAEPATTALAISLAACLGLPELEQQLVVVKDDFFADFVQNCTDIQTRIRIGDDGVVVDGALFTEEHLPAESILYSLLLAHPEFKKAGQSAIQIFKLFTSNLPGIMQIGGNATLGKGIVRIPKIDMP